MTLAVALTAVFIAVLSAPMLTRLLNRAAGWPLGFFYLVSAAALATELSNVGSDNPTTLSIPWVPQRDWTLDFVVDPTGLLFGLIATVIGAIVLAYSAAYLDKNRRYLGFYLIMSIFTLSMLMLVLTDNLVVLYVSWEMTSLASFGLIARSGQAGHPAAVRTLIVTFFGGLFLLSATVLITVRLGTTSIHEILSDPVWTADPTFTAIVALLIAIAAMTKSAQFPFHFWLPDAMAAITPVSAYLHAAAVVKAGIFLLMRFSPAFHDVGVWSAVLIIFGMGTAVMAALFALQKTDLKQLLAYSTVSQLGWIVAAIGVGTPAALSAAAIYVVAHALFKSSLFMLAGVVDHEAGSRDIRRLGPLWKVMPIAFAATLCSALAMAGVPPTLGFISKEAVLTIFADTPGGQWASPVLLIAATIGAILTFAYCARIVFGAFIDGDRSVDGIHDAPPLLTIPAVIPAFAVVALAFIPGIFDPILTALANAATAGFGADHDFHAHLSLWHGLTVELGITAVVIGVGIIFIVKRHAVSSLLNRELLPFEGAKLLQQTIGRLNRVGRAVIAPTSSDSPTRHAAALLTTLAVFGLVMTLSSVLHPESIPSVVGTEVFAVDAVMLVVIAVATLGLVVAASRLAAVILLSAVGIAVTIQIFGLGAPDVGITQLLVEAITIIVFMLVLRRLPGTFVRPSSRRRIGSIILAAAIGTVGATGTWFLTSRRDRSDVGLYLLENGPKITGGENIVNVILVEFRALDTFGEVAVLGMAGIAIIAVISSLRPKMRDPKAEKTIAWPVWVRRGGPESKEALADPVPNTAPLRVLARATVPIFLVVAAIFFFRGHNAPGGGFIAALVVACAMALIYLSFSHDRPLSRPDFPPMVIASGLIIAALTGLAGLGLGTFLEPHHVEIFHVHLSSSMIFDAGVFLCVVGLIAVAINTLGTGRLRGRETDRKPSEELAGVDDHAGPAFDPDISGQGSHPAVPAPHNDEVLS